MTRDQFHNALRILISIDKHELEDAGIVNLDGVGGWQSFRSDPFRWFICASDRDAAAVWSIIERRQS